MSKHTLGINTILHTRDGRVVGNAIVVGRDGNFWKIKTDYGNEVNSLTEQQLHELFYVAYSDREDWDETQQLTQVDHKHKVLDWSGSTVQELKAEDFKLLKYGDRVYCHKNGSFRRYYYIGIVRNDENCYVFGDSTDAISLYIKLDGTFEGEWFTGELPKNFRADVLTQYYQRRIERIRARME